MRHRGMVLALALVAASAFGGGTDGELVAVSVRALKPRGRSNHQLFLFRGNGTPLRQLTSGKGFDNTNPVFSPDGKTIAFQRVPCEKGRASSGGIFTVGVDGRRLSVADNPTSGPEWYSTAKPATPMAAPCDDSNQTVLAGAKTQRDALTTSVYPSPDGKYDILIEKSSHADSLMPLTRVPRGLCLLRDRVSGTVTRIDGLPGVIIEWSFLYALHLDGSPWVWLPPLKTAVFSQHLDSTTGNAYYALEPAIPRLVLLSTNGARVYMVEDTPALFVVSEERYQPLGDGRTVNCLHLDKWDSRFHRTRFSKHLGVFGGASIWVPGSAPVVIRREE